jgi:MFS family permease
MASRNRSGPDGDGLARFWRAFLDLRPTFALAAAWLTTAGHTSNFREMNAARGWVYADGYSLHSIYLLTIALTLLAAPDLVPRFGSFRLVVTGLLFLACGSAVNGIFLDAPLGFLEIGRVLAGIGSGFVIQNAPRLHPPGRMSPVQWAGIILPATGPVLIGFVSYASEWSSWQGGFLFEGILALIALAVILSIAKPLAPEPEPSSSPGYWPVIAIGAVAVWYVMQWGQLHGWLEGPDIFAALLVAAVAFNAVLWLAWPRLNPAAMREGLPRLFLIGYGGFVQYFNASDMGVYGGLLVNFSPFMRSWLVVSLPIGAATAYAVERFVWRTRSPGYAGAAFGLLVLAGGMALSHRTTMNWPYWQVLNTVEFNWFAAPQHWQLAPPRFLMGFGSAMVLLSMMRHASRDPENEARIRPFLQVAQFSGGALSIGVLVTFLLISHQIQYSYAADRGFIQSVELDDRRHRLAEALSSGGSTQPDRQAETLLFRGVNYESDNLVFSEIYSGFLVASGALAGLCVLGWFVERQAGRLPGKPRRNGRT